MALRTQIERRDAHEDGVIPQADERTNIPGRTYQKIREIQQFQVALAVDIYLICEDSELASTWINSIVWSDLRDDHASTQEELIKIDSQLALYSLRHALGKPVITDKEIVVADWQRDNSLPSILYSALRLARLRGDRWRGDEYRPHEFRTTAASVLGVLYTPATQRRWTLFTNEFVILFRWLVEEAASRGQDALHTVTNELDRNWNAPDSQSYWPPHLQRRLLLILQDHAAVREWTTPRLRALLEAEIVGEDNSGRIEEALERAGIWLCLQDREQAVAWVDNAVQASLGVGHSKDYQLGSWVDWLGRWNKLEPGNEADRLQVYAHRTVALDLSGGDGTDYVARQLLDIARAWSPERAVSLYWWMFNQKCFNHFRGVQDWLNWHLDQADLQPSLNLASGLALLKALWLPWFTKDDDTSALSRVIHLVAKRDKSRLATEINRIVN